MKKVLASVLAGSMVLGMAAAASAATTVEIKKGSNDYDYQLYLYEPATVYSTSSSDYQWDEPTEKAFNTYEKAYNTFMNAARSGKDTLKTYFKNLDDANAMSPVDALVDFISMVNLDTHSDLQTDLTSIVNFDVTAATTADDLSNGNPATLDSFTGADGYTTINTTLGANYNDADAIIIGRMFSKNDSTGAGGAAVDVSPAAIKALIPTGAKTTVGSGEYAYKNKESLDITDADQMGLFGLDPHYMYTFGTDEAKEVNFEVIVKHGDDFRVDVADGKVTVSRKRVEADTTNDIDRYKVTVKAAAGVRDFELDDFRIELDCEDANAVYYIEGEVAYSDYREVLPDERYIIKTSNTDKLHDDGCVFDFSEVIDEETRIVCNDYVDVLFKGNYGTDFENMRVLTDDIQEVEDFFQDYDIDYYDFIGTPKFAKDITVRIDADSDAYIYEFDKKTGDVVDITDECEYTSDGMTFKRKSLKTYVVLEEPYEGGNVKAEKEPIVEEEPEDEPEETEEPKDDTSNEGSKPNPGTGAYPLF